MFGSGIAWGVPVSPLTLMVTVGSIGWRSTWVDGDARQAETLALTLSFDSITPSSTEHRLRGSRLGCEPCSKTPPCSSSSHRESRPTRHADWTSGQEGPHVERHQVRHDSLSAERLLVEVSREAENLVRPDGALTGPSELVQCPRGRPLLLQRSPLLVGGDDSDLLAGPRCWIELVVEPLLREATCDLASDHASAHGQNLTVVGEHRPLDAV
jgi:hypothetical protein